jgi:hypothetical protein
MPRADLAQVRALVAAYAATEDGRRALALQADADWTGPALVEAGSRSIRVVPCLAPLSVREALVNYTPEDNLLVVLTPCSGAELGLDVRTRLVKGDVLPLDPFSSILALFGASVLDPEVVAERWLIDDLIALAPSTGWSERLPLGGVLDVDVAWQTWHSARLGLDDEPADLEALVRLGDVPEVGAALAQLAPGHRARVAIRWNETAGAPAQVLVDLLATGNGGDVAALGLVAGTLWATTDQPEVAAVQSLARARLEDRLGRDQLDPATASAWAAASAAVLASSARPADIVDAAEAYLSRADAVELAAYSDVLPRGFDLRLQAIAQALSAGDAERAAGILSWVHLHQLADRRQHRLSAAEAALRLVWRRSARAETTPTTFAAAVDAYAADGAFVDEAVHLLSDGDGIAELAGVYATLAAEAADERAGSVAAFVKLLVEWSRSEPAPDARIVPLEHVLAEVVAPIAASTPVLVVVCDGMGLPVAHQLLRDLRREHWAPAAPETRDGWPVGVALLPTVTEASRTALLTGSRTIGGQAEERAGFTAHPGLRAVSTPTRPPVLFHKAALVGPAGTALPDEVREVVADPDQRVVGVVVNAVDDHLARGDQVRVGWDLASFRPLGWLLDAAAEAGRVVVLTADHGHVLQRPDSIVRQLPGGGERWRIPPPPPQDDEVEVAGPRVLLGNGRVVLPADGRLHYGGHKHGYHGGATPEEVLVPVEVLARRLPDGWQHRPVTTPDWWDAETPSVPPPPPPRLSTSRLGPVSGQASLFETDTGPGPVVAPVARTTWVDGLLASPAFLANRERVRLPRPISDERIRTYLAEVDANGGALQLTALSTRTGEPTDTLRMALTLVQRLVNLDGAEILAVRADGTIELNQQLATIQFELGSS